MDKNIAAILRNDAKTIKVQFEGTEKLYTYVTHLDVQAGDRVVVEARGQFQVVYVKKVDDDLLIEPNSDIRYSWVVDKIDMASHLTNCERNEEIENTLAAAYRNNARRSFAASILAGAPDEQRERLALLVAEGGAQ